MTKHCVEDAKRWFYTMVRNRSEFPSVDKQGVLRRLRIFKLDNIHNKKYWIILVCESLNEHLSNIKRLASDEEKRGRSN